MSLTFAVAELRNELIAFRDLAGELLCPGAESILSGVNAQLDGIAKSSGGPRRWSVETAQPLLTVSSLGEYMPDDNGGLVVHGEMSFVWEIEPVRPKGDSRPARHVRLDGLASTSIRILEGGPYHSPSRELAVWRMEIADSKAPGTFFHVQVLGRDGDDIFPKALDVPRLPGLLNSPLACMEFVMGEIFQRRWARIAQRETGALRQWRGIQARRHQQHLNWASEIIRVGAGSPWIHWKTARPPENLFSTS